MITKAERTWIEEHSIGMTGEAKLKFTQDMIDYFDRKRKPKKPDFAEIKWHEVLPGLIAPPPTTRRIK